MSEKVEILIVEDSPTQALRLKNILHEQGYRVQMAMHGQEALDIILDHEPDLIISDIVMPEIDGFELCQRIKKNEKWRRIPVILLTSLTDSKNVIKGLACGADNFITKPYEPKYLLSRIETILNNLKLRQARKESQGLQIIFGGKQYLIPSEPQQILDFLFSTYETALHQNRELVKTKEELKRLNLQLEGMVAQRTAALTAEVDERKKAQTELQESLNKLHKTMEGTIHTISLMSEIRDPYTAGHERRVSQLACAIAHELRLSKDQVEGIRVAGLLHDIGKISVPIEILSRPGQIRDFEFNMIKIHPQEGFDILKKIEFPWPVAQAVLQHHERMDGSGYPKGLSGSEIILEARILAVADVVEAMSTHRPYRPAIGMERALNEISQNRGVQYDPRVVDACLLLVKEKGFDFESV
ncbi:MAG: response regulator [Syntrophaceae bacterium]|nr:response regulator [Syntrophaceae bacterium]